MRFLEFLKECGLVSGTNHLAVVLGQQWLTPYPQRHCPRRSSRMLPMPSFSAHQFALESSGAPIWFLEAEDFPSLFGHQEALPVQNPRHEP